MAMILLDAKQAAAELHVSTDTLARWRSQRKGPKYVKCVGRICYARHLLDEWLEDCIRSGTRPDG